jgi:hypothetical protein
MLAADKDRLIASVKQTALQLRHKELDYYIERYTNIATQASILAGFAFDGLVELDPTVGGPHDVWVERVFYTAGSCTMAFALYSLCVSSFATVYGHRLALAMVSLIVSATSMAWVKMDKAAAAVTGVFGLLFLVLVYMHQKMKYAFMIDPEMMVQGDVRLQVGPNDVDISRLEAGFGAADGPQQDPDAGVMRGVGPLHPTHIDGGAGIGIGAIGMGGGREHLLGQQR